MMTLKKEVPEVHYYNQDLVDLYVRTWNALDDYWYRGKNSKTPVFCPPGAKVVSMEEFCYSAFFLAYSNRVYAAEDGLNYLYARQEPSGAIRGAYNVETDEAVFTESNPLGLASPLFAWVEFDLFHKLGQKKRIKDIIPVLEKHFKWLDTVSFDEKMGLYAAPQEAGGLSSPAREGTVYPIDFNCQQAVSAYYLSLLGDILNDKEIVFKYKKRYFMIKSQINARMWSDETGFYHDLDAAGERLAPKTAAAFWSLLALLPGKEESELLLAHLSNPATFGTPHPFPSLAADEPLFSDRGAKGLGDVYPFITFMIIKGLEKFERYAPAREAALRHLFYILDTYHPDGDVKGFFWERYLPLKDGPADPPNQKDYVVYVALATITLMIENVVGLIISGPRKTVDWIMPTLELMGVGKLMLKGNSLNILSVKNNRNSWEIRLESEKLYYFTINWLGVKKKTLPIPNGRCSMLLDKL